MRRCSGSRGSAGCCSAPRRSLSDVRYLRTDRSFTEGQVFFIDLAPALNLALVLRVECRSADVLHPLLVPPCGQITTDVAGGAIAKQTRPETKQNARCKVSFQVARLCSTMPKADFPRVHLDQAATFYSGTSSYPRLVDFNRSPIGVFAAPDITSMAR